MTWCIGLLMVVTVLTAGLKWRVAAVAEPHLTSPESAEPAQAGVIFGAYVYPNGTPCPVLEDRLKRGLELYRLGKIEKFLLTGDHGRADYDEVNAMRAYLEQYGVPREVLFCDHAGFDTYDSLYRAQRVFEAESVILVTQSFHLRRALYIAQGLRLQAQGVASDLRAIPEIRSLQVRELAANYKAFSDLLRRRESKLVGPCHPLTGDSAATHDS